MAENTVEILIRARDEATRVLNQTIGQIQAAAAAARSSTLAVARGSEQAGREVQGLARAAQRASRDVLDWAFIMGGLTPQLAVASVTTLQLANAVSEMGTRIGLVTGVIGILGAGLFKLVSHIQETTRGEREYAEAVEKGTLGPIAARIRKLDELAEAIRRGRPSPEDIAAAAAGIAPVQDTAGAEAARAEERAEAVRKLRIAVNLKDLEESDKQRHAINRKRFEEEQDLARRLKELDEASLRGRASAIAVEGRRAIEAEHEINAEALGAYQAYLLAREDAARESARRQLEINARKEGELQRQRVEAEGAISPEQGAAVSVAVLEFEERTLEGTRRAQQPIVSAMTTLGNASADALFDALTGRARNLGEALKSLFEGLARDIFRNTLATLFGGQAQGLSLQNLLSLGGGGRPFGSAAALAAGIPGVSPADIPIVAGPSFAPGTAAEIEARGAGGLLADGGAFSFGGAAMVGIGALGLMGAARAQDPLSGALSGGLGGLGMGLGIAQLTTALGPASLLGPIGLVAGLAFGLFSGIRGSRRRRRQQQRQQRIQQQVQAIQTALEGVDTLEKLEAVSADLFGGIEVPGKAGLAVRLRRLPLEPEARAFLQEQVRQRAAPLIVEFERLRTERATSLEAIDELLAQGFSPDISGAADILEGRLRRRQEILGGLEAVGAIGIEEQLEGGIRRRTIVGAGAFGRERARQAGGQIILDWTAIRRAVREGLTTDAAFLEELFRAIRGHAQAIDYRFDDLEALHV